MRPMEDAYTYDKTPGQIWARRIVFGFIALLVIIIAIQLLVMYLTTGVIDVITGNNNHVTIVSNAEIKTIVRGQGVVSARVHTGNYTIKVTGGTAETDRVVHVVAHKTSSLSLALRPVVAVATVSTTTADSIVASNSVVYFLNSNGQLCSIDDQNNQHVVAATPTFVNIDWVNSSYGVGQGADGALYSISDGSIFPLTSGLGDGNIIVTIAGDDTVYVAKGSNVYQIVGGVARKIMALPGDVAILSANGGTVAAATNPNSEGGTRPTLATINQAGTVKKIGLAVNSVAVSPNGQFIAVSGIGNASRQILNNSLRVVANIPNSTSFASPVWLNNSKLLYGVNSQLWEFNSVTKVSSLLANMPLASPISEITPSDDGSFAYLGVQATGGSSIIERVGLRGQTVPHYLTQLQSIMPYTAEDYFVTLTDFTSPVLYVAPIPPLTNTSDGYVQEASNYFGDLGLKPSELQIRYVSP